MIIEDFLKDKLHFTEREYGFIIRTTNFHQVNDNDIHMQIIEQALYNVLNNKTMITKQAKALITSILYKCASYRFDLQIEQVLGESNE